MTGWVVLALLLALALALLPTWPYSRKWTYWPSGMIALLIVLVLVLIFAGVFEAT